MKDFKPMVKMQCGGSVGLGHAQPSGPMGIAASGEKVSPSIEATPRVGYKCGGKTKKKGK